MVHATIPLGSPDLAGSGPPSGPAGVDHAITGALGGELVRLMKLLAALRTHLPSPHPGVDHTHYPVLFALVDGPRRVSDLANCAHTDVSTVSRQVTHLVEHRLLDKLPDSDDGRVQRVSLTEQGRLAIDRAVSLRGTWLTSIMTDWSDDEARDFLRHISRFTESLETAKAGFEPTAR